MPLLQFCTHSTTFSCHCCFTSLCTHCCLIAWHVLPQVSPAVPLRGLLHHSQLLSIYLSILVSNLGYKAGPFSRQCYWKHRSVPGSLGHTSSCPPTPGRLWRSGCCRSLLLPLGERAVKSPAHEPINSDRFAVASSEVKGVHYAHSQSRWLTVKQTVIEIFIREKSGVLK